MRVLIEIDMRMLSADLKSRGLRQEHGVNSRCIRLMWVCGSGLVCDDQGVSPCVSLQG